MWWGLQEQEVQSPLFKLVVLTVSRAPRPPYPFSTEPPHRGPVQGASPRNGHEMSTHRPWPGPSLIRRKTTERQWSANGT